VNIEKKEDSIASELEQEHKREAEQVPFSLS
jgi:hypothetical protein